MVLDSLSFQSWHCCSLNGFNHYQGISDLRIQFYFYFNVASKFHESKVLQCRPKLIEVARTLYFFLNYCNRLTIYTSRNILHYLYCKKRCLSFIEVHFISNLPIYGKHNFWMNIYINFNHYFSIVWKLFATLQTF